MSSTTVAEFAAELKKSTDTLLEQLKSAGVAKSAATDTLNDADKQKLLGFLQASHGTSTQERKKITLVKKSTSEIKQADSSGKARTIQVEVRKKRTFVKREDGVEVPVDQPEQFAAATPAAVCSASVSRAASSAGVSAAPPCQRSRVTRAAQRRSGAGRRTDHIHSVEASPGLPPAALPCPCGNRSDRTSAGGARGKVCSYSRARGA